MSKPENPKLIGYDYIRDGSNNTVQSSDITLRDLLAAAGAIGIIANQNFNSGDIMIGPDGNEITYWCDAVAHDAYNLADALLAERERREGGE